MPMIVLTYNEVMNAIGLAVDEEGADILIDHLNKLKREKFKSHYHLFAPDHLDDKCPYGSNTVYKELILDWVERD